MPKISTTWLRLWVFVLLLWFLFGVAVATMIVYGVFDHVAMSPAVMATTVATGTAMIVAFMGFAILGVVKRINRSQPDGASK